MTMGLATSAPAPVDQRMGDEADEGGGGGHHAGAYSSRAGHDDGVTDVLDAFHFSLAKQVVDVGGDEDGIVVHDAEDGDEAYPDGDAEVAAKQVLEPDSARNGRRNPGKERRNSYFISGIQTSLYPGAL